MNKHPYFYWLNRLTKKEIKNINNIIENNFNSFEEHNQGATDLKGNFKKNSKVKQIEYKYIEKEVKEIMDFAFMCNTQYYGYNIYQMSGNQLALYNIYSSQ